MAECPPYLLAAILVMSSVVWWIVAPFFVRAADPRLRVRNPDHSARLVNFYRAWGCVAILVGATISLAL
ncbi:MAG: hypothetical protein CVT67_07115 [Actinobacteria bacterium HGW-Actinobacteria-7]|nr:MAG: hypothetical protein CVT67_07115 [Actinobacteria bacterium HGW-Actinobacteria-7]